MNSIKYSRFYRLMIVSLRFTFKLRKMKKTKKQTIRSEILPWNCSNAWVSCPKTGITVVCKTVQSMMKISMKRYKLLSITINKLNENMLNI